MSRRARLWAAVVLVAAALGLLVGYGSKNLTEYYLTIPQFEARAAQLVGQRFRVAGQLVGRSVHYDVTRHLLTFVVHHGSLQLQVVYHGVQPDTFQSNVTVIVDGVYRGHDLFDADQVLVQCPSHYGPARNGKSA